MVLQPTLCIDTNNRFKNLTLIQNEAHFVHSSNIASRNIPYGMIAEENIIFKKDIKVTLGKDCEVTDARSF